MHPAIRYRVVNYVGGSVERPYDINGSQGSSDNGVSAVGADTVTSDADARSAVVAELTLEELRFTDLTGLPLTGPVPKARYELRAP